MYYSEKSETKAWENNGAVEDFSCRETRKSTEETAIGDKGAYLRLGMLGLLCRS